LFYCNFVSIFFKLYPLITYIQDHDSKMSDEHRDTDDSSEKTPSRMSRSPQKSSKRPKTVPVKVTLLDGSAYETGVEVQQLLACAKTNMCCSEETWCQTSRAHSYFTHCCAVVLNSFVKSTRPLPTA
jgi:hypothetical protein